MKIPNTRLLCLIVILAFVPVSSSIAGELSAVISGKSYHINSSHDWNEDNLGLGLEYTFEPTSRWRKVLFANGFRDSENEMSYMAGGGIHRRLLQSERLKGFYIDAGINAFIMTRQDYNDNRPFPGALPSLAFGNRNVGLNVTYLPKKLLERVMNTEVVDPTLTGVFFLQLKIRFDRLQPDD